MNINEFYKELNKNTDLFIIMLGINASQFHELLTAFMINKFRDNTRKKNDTEKVISVLLIERFKMDDKKIQEIILESKDSRTLKLFKEKVFNRFNEVVASLPDPLKSTVLEARVPVISIFVFYQYRDLEELIDIAKSRLSTDAFTTRREPETSQSWLDRYLTRPVTAKKKGGQDNFLQLLNCSLFDLEQFPSVNEYVIWYTAILMNIFVHNSSHIPKGFGKAQAREMNHLNYYFRSQNNHSHTLFFKALTTDKKNKQCIGPRNESLVHLINLSTDNKFTKNLRRYDRLGYVKPGKEAVKYFSASFAHSGLRRNNYGIYITALEEYLVHNSIELLIEKLKKEKIFSGVFQKQIIKCSDTVLEARTHSLHERFYQYQCVMKNQVMHQNLLSEIIEKRMSRAMFIVEQCVQYKFRNIQIYYEKNSTCLFVQFYPNQTLPDNKNYKRGVTNVVIGFFGGLVNHHCERNGFFIRTQRRQSFGFYRPTLTNVGNMRMRISLGLEPECYDSVVIESLYDLDHLLGEYNFSDRKNPNLSRGFEVVEKSQSKKGDTSNTGIRFLKAMRSEMKTHMALDYAQCYLNELANVEQYKSKAFKKYIDTICSDDFLDSIADPDRSVPISPVAISSNSVEGRMNETDKVILKLLFNLILFTLNYINKDSNFDGKFFAYSYWHVLTKLYRYCLKSHHILLNQDKYPATHIYAQASLLIDHILEYLIVLDGIRLIQRRELGQSSDPIEKLVHTETTYTAERLNLQLKDVNAFFTDSGQQANVVSIFTISQQMYQRNNLNDSLYIYPKFYYELSRFIEDDLEVTICLNPNNAKILLLDITEIETIDLQRDKVFIIDITNNPCLNNAKLKEIIRTLQALDNYVLLTSSMLKHEQLNLDKYQVGKIIVLSPHQKPLDTNIIDEFHQISKNAIHPIVASFINIVNEVSQEKRINAQEQLKPEKKNLNTANLINNFFASRFHAITTFPASKELRVTQDNNELTSYIMKFVNSNS